MSDEPVDPHYELPTGLMLAFGRFQTLLRVHQAQAEDEEADTGADAFRAFAEYAGFPEERLESLKDLITDSIAVTNEEDANAFQAGILTGVILGWLAWREGMGL